MWVDNAGPRGRGTGFNRCFVGGTWGTRDKGSKAMNWPGIGMVGYSGVGMMWFGTKGGPGGPACGSGCSRGR